MAYQSDLMALLSEVEIFRDVEPNTLQAVVQAVEAREVACGEYLFREGDRADFMFVVLHGTLEVRKTASLAEGFPSVVCS